MAKVMIYVEQDWYLINTNNDVFSNDIFSILHASVSIYVSNVIYSEVLELNIMYKIMISSLPRFQFSIFFTTAVGREIDLSWSLELAYYCITTSYPLIPWQSVSKGT